MQFPRAYSISLGGKVSPHGRVTLAKIVVQCAVQIAIFTFFGAVVIADEIPPYDSAIVLTVVGFIGAFAGLLLQRWFFETGVVVVSVSLLLLALSSGFSVILGYIIVCYEAYQISARMKQRRRLWMYILVCGSLLGCISVISIGMSWKYLDDAGEFTEGHWDTSIWGEPSTYVALLIGVTLTLASIGLTWMLGREERRRSEKIEQLQAQAELAALSERNRIAREMHDIVAHTLTAVIAQADGGRYAGKQHPEQAIEALETISVRGREALAQMRSLLSVLRDSDDARLIEATPGVMGIPDLIADANRNGIRTNFITQGHLDEGQIDEILGLTLYRIVQESLTNVLRHAGTVEATVNLEYQHNGVSLTVDNESGEESLENIEGSGRGLTGIAERVRIHKGTVHWGESQIYPGGWNVSVHIPLKNA